MKKKFEISVKQKKINYRSIVVSVPDAERIAREEHAEKMRITAEMTYGGEVFIPVTEDGEPSSRWKLEVPAYGRWEVTVEFLSGGRSVLSQRTDVGVAAEKYNIAPLIASIPVLIFSLKFFADDGDGIEKHLPNGDPVPTIVALARYRQYDWDKLPNGMFPIPYLAKKDRTDVDTDLLRTSMPKISAYVRGLVEINPDSAFCFYMNGYHAGWILPDLVFYMGLNPANYSLRFLSDYELPTIMRLN